VIEKGENAWLGSVCRCVVPLCSAQLPRYLLSDVTGTAHPGLMYPIATRAGCLEQYIREYYAACVILEEKECWLHPRSAAVPVGIGRIVPRRAPFQLLAFNNSRTHTLQASAHSKASDERPLPWKDDVPSSLASELAFATRY